MMCSRAASDVRKASARPSGLSELADGDMSDPNMMPSSQQAPLQVLDGSSRVLLDGHLCGLFAVDIVAFNARHRDDDIRVYVHKSLYEMLQIAFDRSDVPWAHCAYEDCGDGVLVIVPPTIPFAHMATVPDRLRILVRRHNHVSSDAAQLQLRTAMHIGSVHHDGYGFVGHDISLLFRLLDARALRRMLSESGAEVAFIASGDTYEHVIRRNPSLSELALFRRLLVRVKETRTRAWACTPGALLPRPPRLAVPAIG